MTATKVGGVTAVWGRLGTSKVFHPHSSYPHIGPVYTKTSQKNRFGKKLKGTWGKSGRYTNASWCCEKARENLTSQQCQTWGKYGNSLSQQPNRKMFTKQRVTFTKGAGVCPLSKMTKISLHLLMQSTVLRDETCKVHPTGWPQSSADESFLCSCFAENEHTPHSLCYCGSYFSPTG